MCKNGLISMNETMGVLTFKLPEDEDRFKIASNSIGWALAMWDLDEVLRHKVKYAEKDSEFLKGVEWAREKLYEELDAHGVSMDDII